MGWNGARYNVKMENVWDGMKSRKEGTFLMVLWNIKAVAMCGIPALLADIDDKCGMVAGTPWSMGLLNRCH